MTLPARAWLALFGGGAAFIAYGSIATLPGTTPGQIVVTVFAGAGMLLIGAVHLAVLLVREPGKADQLLELLLARAPLQRFVPTLVTRTAFAEVPTLRWGLCAALVVVAAFAAAVLASDVFAWSRLAWAVPVGAERVILG
jgi:hypothetical protein